MAVDKLKKMLVLVTVATISVVAIAVMHQMRSKNMEYAYPSPFWSKEGNAVAIRELRIPSEALTAVKKTLSQFASAEGLQFLERKSHPTEPWYDFHIWNRKMEVTISNLVYPEQYKLYLYVLPGSEAENAGRIAFTRVVSVLSSLPGAMAVPSKVVQ